MNAHTSILLLILSVSLAWHLRPSYKKVGGLHFVRTGRYGASFYVASC